MECPTLVLQNRNADSCGKLTGFTGFLRKENLNAPNEISCTVYKYTDGERNPLWDNITDFKVIYIPEYKEKYEIHISSAEEIEITKSITGTALAEAELSQLLLDQIEINTENDMARTSTIPGVGYDENFPTVFYRDPDKIHDYGAVWNSSARYQNYSAEDKREVLRTSSLLHRLLEKAPNYRIGHIDDTLESLNLVLTFSISNTYLYNELVGEIAEEYGVLFTFDSVDKTVSAYDLFNTCDDCGYRGDFENICPKCGSASCHGQYGEDTAIFVSGKNLAESVSKDGDPDSVKTSFRIEGGDDVMTAAVANINPGGTNYIYSIPAELIRDMPTELVEKIESYNRIYNEYNDTHTFDLYVENYNESVEYLKKYYPDAEYPKFSNPLIGYDQTTNLLYNIIDVESVLKSSMMPTLKYDNPAIDETMEIISKMSDIAVRYPATSIATYVNNAVLDMVKASINTALYKAEIYENNGYPQYTQGTTGIWYGYIKLTSLEAAEREIAESRVSDLLTFPITNNVELYIKQKIQKNMSKVEISEIMDLTNVGDNAMLIDEFKERLHCYSADYLDNLKTEFEACRSVIYEMKDVADNQTYSDFLNTYNERVSAIVIEKNARDRQLEKLYRLYYLNQTDFTESGELIDARNNVKKDLNFEKYLGDLWPVFCSYLREDTYQNSNYISVGLSSQEIIERAKELWEAANRELEKASHTQYTISTTLDNLLQIPAFSPLTKYFQVGNWIHVAFDDEVYRLRLLSYQINFDELQTIEVEFSTVVHHGGSFSDVKDVIDSARTISGSYNAVTNQVQKTADAAIYVNEWVKDGLNATMTKYVNDPLTQDIVIDKNGILCRAYDDLKEDYDPHQVRIIKNGLYFSSDGWETIHTGIGRISYHDPVKNEYIDDYGIIANTVVGRLVLGEFLGFANADGSMQFDENGLSVKGYHTAVCINPNTANVFSIKKKSSSGSYDTDVMYVDKDGNGYFEGEIYSTSGKIGGWDIGDGYMRSKDTRNRYVGFGIDDVSQAFYAGGSKADGSDGVFRVGHSGELIATNATISGKITGKSIDIQASDKIDTSVVDGGIWEAGLSADAEHGVYLGYDQGNYGGSITMNEGNILIGDANSVSLGSPQTVSIWGFDVSVEAGNGFVVLGDEVVTGILTCNSNLHCNGNIDCSGRLFVDNWVYCTENTGIWWPSHNGGWYMSDSIWIRTYNNKSIFSGTGQIRSDAVGDAFLALRADAVDNRIKVQNSVASISLLAAASGNHGLWSHTHSKWIIVTSPSGDTTLRGHATGDLPLSGGTVNGSVAIKGQVEVSGAIKCANTYTNTVTNAANMYITSNYNFRRSTASSKRYKHDIRSLTGSLEASKLLTVPVVQYIYNADYLSEEDARYGKYIPGFIAEDIAELYPIAVETDEEGRPEDWNIRLIVPPMLQLIQDACEKISGHSSHITILQEKIARQEAEIQALKAKLQP